jgi:hypothetical protein
MTINHDSQLLKKMLLADVTFHLFTLFRIFHSAVSLFEYIKSTRRYSVLKCLNTRRQYKNIVYIDMKKCII